MKKILVSVMMCIVFIASALCINATQQESGFSEGFAIEFNGEATESASVIGRGIHYVPMRTMFEKFGAYVFYRDSDCRILALSRDGDIISHIPGEKSINVNGENKIFEVSSALINGETYIPVDMISAAFCPDGIFYDEQKLKIQKYFFNNDYHKATKDILDVCISSNFYGERFQRYINYHVNNPDYSVQEVIFRVNLGLDYAFYENMTTIEHPYELLVLVNKYNKLPDGFRQYNLVNMDRKHTANDGKEYLLASGAYDKYIEMSDAAKQSGLSMRVVSAYRTEDYQRSLYNTKVRTSGFNYAEKYSARAGHSEHHTGLAIDIGTTKGTFEYTAEFKWLKDHAHLYGYILRYPKGKEWITGYAYEPWHYRYVGVDAAKIIYEEGITYEEFCAKYISVNEFRYVGNNQ